jgi:hypothetical protein
MFIKEAGFAEVAESEMLAMWRGIQPAAFCPSLD